MNTTNVDNNTTLAHFFGETADEATICLQAKAIDTLREQVAALSAELQSLAALAGGVATDNAHAAVIIRNALRKL